MSHRHSLWQEQNRWSEKSCHRPHSIIFKRNVETSEVVSHPITNWIQKSLLAPVLSANQVAGCLTVCSPEAQIFTSSHLKLLENYAHLIALVIPAEDFYTFERISLAVMPPQEAQKPIIAHFHSHVAELMQKTQQEEQSMGRARAEQPIWLQLEEEVIQQPFSEAFNLTC